MTSPQGMRCSQNGIHAVNPLPVSGKRRTMNVLDTKVVVTAQTIDVLDTLVVVTAQTINVLDKIV